MRWSRYAAIPFLCLLLAGALLAPARAGYSQDQLPAETPLDPGKLFFVGGGVEVDDVCTPPPPFPFPCLGVPDPEQFDLNGFSVNEARPVCPPGPPPSQPGILFSFDDGDPGAGSGPPAHATEIFFYDRCRLFGGRSYFTSGDEVTLGLGGNPPPPGADDDADAYEAAAVSAFWDAGTALLFSPDNTAPGGLGPDPACPPSKPGGTIYSSDPSKSALFFASPCSLGVPDTSVCDVDGLTLTAGEPPFEAAPYEILFTTDAEAPCGLDPGDIYISDNAGNFALWADDVTDLRIATSEADRIDVDALSINEDGPLQPDPGRPFVPQRVFWKRGWPDYAPNGVPDVSQDHASFPPAFCAPAAAADALWWMDSKIEGRCGGAPCDTDDDFKLVEAVSPATGDHCPDNPEPLVQDLAACMHTDPVGGTFPADVTTCLKLRLDASGRPGLFSVQQTPSPSFGEIACAVEASHAVILELGFWNGPGSRCGGHFVAVAGVERARDPGPDGAPGAVGIDDDGDGLIDEDDELCPCVGRIPTPFGDDSCGGPGDRVAVADPGLNNAETGAPGRVVGPAHVNHAPAAVPPPDHDDVQNASHDRYGVQPGSIPGYLAELSGYGMPSEGDLTTCGVVQRWCSQNPDPETPFEPCVPPSTVLVEIEQAIEIVPRATPVCLDLRLGLGDMWVRRGACPAPASVPTPFDYVRGEVCQLSEVPGKVDLGEIDALSDDDPVDQHFDDTTWDATDGIGAWFFLARDDLAGCDYGVSSRGNPRVATTGDAPCP